jgi:hypothetical protein
MNAEEKVGSEFTLPDRLPNRERMKIGIDSFVAAVPDALMGENLGPADRLKLLLDICVISSRSLRREADGSSGANAAHVTTFAESADLGSVTSIAPKFLYTSDI